MSNERLGQCCLKHPRLSLDYTRRVRGFGLFGYFQFFVFTSPTISRSRKVPARDHKRKENNEHTQGDLAPEQCCDTSVMRDIAYRRVAWSRL
jgi:hypothetical protein